MRGGKRKGAGRKPVPEHLKRNKMTGVRIQQWLLDWLMSQPESSGKIIERVLVERYDLDNPCK